jgi:hypothetical protein
LALVDNSPIVTMPRVIASAEDSTNGSVATQASPEPSDDIHGTRFACDLDPVRPPEAHG